jgi:glycosyltransferase involved in cell wall biosynthesis
MTIIEAMAFGVPSIVPNVGGPKEIVDQTGCGVSCNTEQKEDVLQCIEQLLSDKKAYEMLSQKCLEQVKEFTLNQMQKKISTIVYEKFNS